MEHWSSILFFAAAFISITRAQLNCDDRILSQPNIANMSQQNIANVPQPNFQDMPQPNFVSCEFYARENAKAHHTEKYDLLDERDPSPVLRRGQPFRMAILFDRPFNMDSDSVVLEFTLGSKRMKKRGPPVFLPVTPKRGFTHYPSNWDISLTRYSESSRHLTLQIQIPYTAAVGVWRMNVISNVRGGNQPKKHGCNKDVYILFNPWSEGDLVYMEDDIGRREYVLNEVGQLYRGEADDYDPMFWNFAQFHTTVLRASVFILEKAQTLNRPYLDFASRGDPIKVVSTISAMANNEDDDGVLEGNWSDNFEGGTPPGEWTGSEPILKEYVMSGGTPVKYGQCWVFSALSTTIARALGIPCRSVTNFASPVDKNKDLVATRYMDDDGNDSGETIWNFHVWNECWMIRPDLPAEFSGWQAFDGTAEERDETKIFRAGPASVEAVRRGEIETVYNSQVFSSATNSDAYYFTIDRQNYKRLDRIDTREVGELTLTMHPSGHEHDITLTYKPPEGTHEERYVYNYARRKLGRNFRGIANPKKRKEKEDVCFKLRHMPKIMIGKKVKMFVDVANNSLKKRTIYFTATISSVYYTGVTANKVKSDKGKVILQPSQRKTLVFEVGPNMYLDKLVQFCMMRAYVHARVFETNQTWTTEDNFKFSKPPLQIEYLDMTTRPKLHKPVEVRFSFTNPLNVTLKDCAIVMEGLGLIEYGKTKLGDLGPGEALTHVETITPKKVGSHRLCAILTSRQIVTILGSKQLEVEE